MRPNPAHTTVLVFSPGSDVWERRHDHCAPRRLGFMLMEFEARLALPKSNVRRMRDWLEPQWNLWKEKLGHSDSG
jgi:hypothetical protein